MAYTPTEWKTGDTITAEKLNKMENGIASADSVFSQVTYSQETGLSATYAEISEMLTAGKIPVLAYTEAPDVGVTGHAMLYTLTEAGNADGYYATFVAGEETITFQSETEDGTMDVTLG